MKNEKEENRRLQICENKRDHGLARNLPSQRPLLICQMKWACLNVSLLELR